VGYLSDAGDGTVGVGGDEGRFQLVDLLDNLLGVFRR
jgi:hypothetical protein